MRLYLVNPSNPLVSIVKVKESRWNRYRVWKPLSLMVLAGLTPSEWEISIVDENLGAPDYPGMPRPDLVGITAFTSQANRAYEVATHFRRLGVPVVMGGKIDKNIYTDYKGRRVYFCCPSCKETFAKDPEKYLKKLPGEGK
jgi:YHS domain-containing protein